MTQQSYCKFYYTSLHKFMLVLLALFCFIWWGQVKRIGRLEPFSFIGIFPRWRKFRLHKYKIICSILGWSRWLVRPDCQRWWDYAAHGSSDCQPEGGPDGALRSKWCFHKGVKCKSALRWQTLACETWKKLFIYQMSPKMNGEEWPPQ